MGHVGSHRLALELGGRSPLLEWNIRTSPIQYTMLTSPARSHAWCAYICEDAQVGLRIHLVSVAMECFQNIRDSDASGRPPPQEPPTPACC